MRKNHEREKSSIEIRDEESLHPVIANALNRISNASREERPRSIVVKPETYRILQRHMIGNCTDTLAMLCEVSDIALMKVQENIR